MARGPFQGTYVSGVRPTIVTAPDALVYLNGNSEAVGCPQCKKKFPFNRYITSIQVDLSIDSPPGSANINLSIPHHTVDNFFFDGEPIVSPMMEVEIFAKGHFLVEGIPQYYPIFWGLVTEVTDSWSGGETSVTIHCADILKWWEVCKMAVNSAFTSPQPGALGMSLMGNVFFGANPYDLIWTLAQQSFGDVVVGTGSLLALNKEKEQTDTFHAAMKDIMLYWNDRFTRIRSNLLLYGTSGVAVRGDSLFETMNKGKPKLGAPFASRAVALANGGPDAGQMVFDPTDPEVRAFRTNFQVSVPFWQSEYQTKLELATAAKDAIGFEFYMDVDGSIVFKPPFYNLDILGNKPVSWIQDIDVIDWDFSTSEAEVVTQIQIQGAMYGNTDYGFGEETTPTTTVTDYHLLRQYGWRTQTMNSEFLGDPLQMFYYGMDMLDRINSRRHRASISIPIRPELRLGFPVYVAGKDQMWYLTGLSHNIQFGGRATSSLTLSSRRAKWIAPTGVGTIKLTSYQGKAPPPLDADKKVQISSRQLQAQGRFQVDVDDPAIIPPATSITYGQPSPYDPMILRHPKTGRIVGFPNACMVYTRPVKAPNNTVAKNLGQKEPGTNPAISSQARKSIDQRQGEKLDKIATLLNANNDVKLRERYITNRYSYGVNSAGAYVYARDTSKLIREIAIIPAKNIDVKSSSTTVVAPKTASGMIRPVSDERGFEVVGHFRYGRGVSLRDGRLVIRDGSVNDSANVSPQVALGGDLYAVLRAQSQGLTTTTESFENPADLLSKMAPEDSQTAGYVSPDTKEPVWSDTRDNFVDAAPLGSPEQLGVPSSVEAGQLSRALTLAEMSVTTDDIVNDQDCACVLGRSDLAFLVAGVNQKTIRTTGSDNSTLVGAAGVISNSALPLKASESTHKLGDFMNKVDEFLWDLYSAADGSHQAYEKGIRGDNLPADPNSPTDIRFGTTSPTQGNLTPPFNAPGRFAVGDPRAIALQADSAVNDLAKKWDSFGGELKKATETAAAQKELANDQNNLTQAKKQKEDLLRAKQSGAEAAVANLLGGPDAETLLKRLDQRIADLEKDIASKQAKLNGI